MESAAFDLDRIRAEFPILRNRNYLNSCSLGALSHRAEARLSDFLQQWHTMGASAWYDHWMGAIATLRGRVAGFLRCPPSTLALLPSTSAALSVIGESVHATPERNRVVTTELDFPTLLHQWRVKPEIELIVLRSPDGIRIDPEQFGEVVDERTLFLATSHVFFATGFIQDLPALARIARDAGAFSLIDGYQGPGQIPVDVVGSGVDAYTTGPLKWLCGGPGLAYLYVREPLVRTLEPRITSWFAARDMFSFDAESFAFQDDARRFELGTPALATVHTALGGQEVLDDVGMERIASRNRDLTDALIDGCRESGLDLKISDDPDSRSNIVLVRSADPASAVAALADRGIIVDHRPGCVRVSPHFYNTADEIQACVQALREVLR